MPRPNVFLSLPLLLASASFGTTAQSPSVTAQFGGPNRNFMYEASGLAATWPETGPKQLWKRPLGDGYSGIAAAADGRLYSMYRADEQREAVIALDAATGQTVWEFKYEAPFTKEYVLEQGPGPRATPLVVGERVFSAGATGILHALDATTGQSLWSHDLIAAYGGHVRVRGFACSPLAFKDTVIMQVGGKDAAVIAFKQSDGSVAWKSGSFQNSYASPILIDVDGQQQLVAYLFAEVVGMDPHDGRVLWSHPHPTDSGLNISTPVWGPDNVLLLSSAYGGGTRAIHLSQAGGRTTVKEVWHHRLMRVHFGTVIRVGDHAYGASGDFGPAPFVAIDMKSGNVLWRNRDLAKANMIHADGRFIAVDEEGHLSLATPSPEGLKVHAKVPLLTSVAWTAPTLVGTTLYVRDRKDIMAFDVGAPGSR
jgi:outer membrane protein assembly factor BamB